MKKFTNQDIDQFFVNFKELPAAIPLNKVHQLIDSPHVKAKHAGRVLKHLKIIIMTSIFISLFTFISLWWNFSSEEKTPLPGSGLIGTKNEEIKQETSKIYRESTVYPNIKKNSAKQNPIHEFSTEANAVALNTANSKLSEKAEVVRDKPIPITEGLHLIELTKEELQQVGFSITDSTLSYRIRNRDNYKIEIGFFKRGNWGYLTEDSSLSGSKSWINLLYLSNLYGEHNILWTDAASDTLKYTPEYFKSKIQFLVPILVRQSNFPSILYQDQIFWFEPGDELFAALPPSIGDQLKKEYNYITAKSNNEKSEPAPECKYYEACKSSFDLQKLTISPNPANQYSNIEFTLGSPIKGSISLVNINGAFAKQLVYSAVFNKGVNSFKVDVSDVAPGIYLVLINTSQGSGTQRLVITR